MRMAWACFVLIIVVTAFRAAIALMFLLPQISGDLLRECGNAFLYAFPGTSWLMTSWCLLWLPMIGDFSERCKWHVRMVQLSMTMVSATNLFLIPTSTAIILAANRQASRHAQQQLSVRPTLLMAEALSKVEYQLPHLTYTSFRFADTKGSEIHGPCVICLRDYAVGDQLARLACGHVHHEDCIRLWFRSGASSCPMRCSPTEAARKAVAELPSSRSRATHPEGSSSQVAALRPTTPRSDNQV